MDTERILNHEEDQCTNLQQSSASNVNSKQLKRFLWNLSVVVLILGVVCVALGCVLTEIIAAKPWVEYKIIEDNYTSTGVWFRATNGAGIWGGFLMLVSGILGILASRKNVSNVLIHVLMAFSIIGASTSFAASISAAIYAAINGGYQREIYYAGLKFTIMYGILSFLSFLSCVLQVIGASICCPLVGCCEKGGCCYNQVSRYNRQITHQTQPFQYQTVVHPIRTEPGYPAPSYNQSNMQYSAPSMMTPAQTTTYQVHTNNQLLSGSMNPNPQNFSTPVNQPVLY